MRVEMSSAVSSDDGRRRRAVRLAICLGIGVCVGLSYSSQFMSLTERPTFEQAFLLVYLTCLFGAVAYWLTFRKVWPRLAHQNPRAGLWWGVGSLAVGGLLVAVIPVRVALPPSWHTLQIIATGQRNPAAQGSEVWVTAIQKPDGSKIPASELTLTGDWEVRGGVPLSYRNQPASLGWSGALNGDVTLTFVAHQRSGVVQVVWDGHSQQLDLYQDIAGNKMLTVAPATRQPLSALSVGLTAALAVALGWLVFVVNAWLVGRPVRAPMPARVSRWAWLYYALPCIVVWSAYLLAFWPGLMSPDSIGQWGQMLTGSYSDVIVPLHTMTNWLVTRAWLSPAAPATMQLVILGVLIGLGLQQLRRLGAPRAVTWVICALLALSPAISSLVITLWKDIPYTVLTLALTLLVFDIVVSHGNSLRRRAYWLLLGVIGGLVAAYRYNGPVPAFGTLMILLIAYHPWKRQLLLSLLTAIALWQGVQVPLYNVLHVQRARWTSLQPILFQVAAHVAAGTELSREERSYLEDARSLADGWQYDCHSIDSTLFSGRFNLGVVDKDPHRIIEIWWDLTRRNPLVNLEHIVCNSTLVWQVTQPGSACLHTVPIFIENGNVRTIASNPYGLREHSLLPQIEPLLTSLYMWTIENSQVWLVWRPALYLYLALGSVALVALRVRTWRYLLILLPVCLNALALALTATDCDSRFHFPIYLVGMMMLGLLAF